MRKNITYKKEERAYHVKQCLKWIASGNSIRGYGLNHVINPRTLHGWVSRHHDQSSLGDSETSSLVRVRRKKSQSKRPTSETSSLRVVVGALAIELPAGNSDHDLKRVLTTLKEMI